MPSIPSRQSIWNPLAAYALIKVLGWLRREPDRPDVEAPRNQHWPAETVDRSSDTASRKRRPSLIMGFSATGGCFVMQRFAGSIIRQPDSVLPWHTIRCFPSARSC